MLSSTTRISQYINLSLGVTKKFVKELKNKTRLIKLGFFNHKEIPDPLYENEIMELRKKFLPEINYYTEEYKELNKEGKIVTKSRNLILPKCRPDGSVILKEDTVDYDLRVYLMALFLVSWEINRLQLVKDQKAGKSFNVLPLMKDNIYGCI